MTASMKNTDTAAPTASSIDRATAGIHHITAVASEPQRNLDFYIGVLGLKLVKRTVNFDDPSTYHFYFGDEMGRPGTILTFFPWPTAGRGTQGTGSVFATAFAVPAGSLEAWEKKLAAGGVVDIKAFTRFGQRGLAFEDHDGMRLELIETTGHSSGAAIIGFHSATLLVRSGEYTKRLLREQFGMREEGAEGGRTRFVAMGQGASLNAGTHAGQLGAVVDVVEDPSAAPARLGAGVVHHIALRASDDDQQRRMSESISRQGLMVTEQRDRNYFRSVYFRERGGVLFEIATDAPGFAIDEPTQDLGMSLKLPPQYERARKELERTLPKIEVARADVAAKTAAISAYRHLWKPADGATASTPTVLLLHGTGGSQFDLVDMASRVAPGTNILSPLGNVSEGGAARFFRRFAEGVFDLADVQQRAGQLARFLNAASVRYGFDRRNVVAIGFSNGANIAGAMLLLEPESLRGAVLLRGMTTLTEGLATRPAGSGASVLLLSGREDPMGTPANAGNLAGLLTSAGHRVQHETLGAGHNLVRDDVEITRQVMETWMGK